MKDESSRNSKNAVTDTTSASVENKGRRLQDNVAIRDPARKLNLDRRIRTIDRRDLNAPDYTGPVRRYTIDRRQRTRDRRAAVIT
jgi:hypothetical protein